MFTAGFWVIAASLWMQVGYMGATLGRIATGSMQVHVDFDSFWLSAKAMLEGQDIYDTGVKIVNLNPPVWTALISPLGVLEPITAYRVFVLISLVVTIGSLVWTVEELRLRPGWTVVGVVMLLLAAARHAGARAGLSRACPLARGGLDRRQAREARDLGRRPRPRRGPQAFASTR